MEYIGVITHLLTTDPNFLGHPSMHLLFKKNTEAFVSCVWYDLPRLQVIDLWCLGEKNLVIGKIDGVQTGWLKRSSKKHWWSNIAMQYGPLWRCISFEVFFPLSSRILMVDTSHPQVIGL